MQGDVVTGTRRLRAECIQAFMARLRVANCEPNHLQICASTLGVISCNAVSTMPKTMGCSGNEHKFNSRMLICTDCHIVQG